MRVILVLGHAKDLRMAMLIFSVYIGDTSCLYVSSLQKMDTPPHSPMLFDSIRRWESNIPQKRKNIKRSRVGHSNVLLVILWRSSMRSLIIFNLICHQREVPI